MFVDGRAPALRACASVETKNFQEIFELQVPCWSRYGGKAPPTRPTVYLFDLADRLMTSNSSHTPIAWFMRSNANQSRHEQAR
jgi:hypothetical protein